MRSPKAFFATGAVALVLAAPLATQADVVYTFTSTEVAAYGTGPYGTVTLTDNGTGIDFSVALRSDLNFVNTGNHSVFSFNATGVATTDVTNILFNGVSNSNFTVVSPGTNPPFGNNSFDLMIDCTADDCKNGAPGQSVDPLTFSIANAEFTDFGILADDTTAFFAADVICTDVLDDGCTEKGATGAIGVVNAGSSGTSGTSGNSGTSGTSGTTGTVPTPGTSSLVLLALGLMGATFWKRRAGATQA